MLNTSLQWPVQHMSEVNNSKQQQKNKTAANNTDTATIITKLW